MTVQHDCDNMQSQFLTREALFVSRLARVHVFDGITHGVAVKLLNKALVMPLRSYFKLPVLLVNDAANLYCIEANTLKKVLVPDENKQELMGDGLLLLTRNDIQYAHEQLGTPLQLKKLVLLPPRAILKLALFLPATPAIVATVDALWDYVLDHGLNDSTPSNWRKTFERENVRVGHSISRVELQAKQKQFKNLGLYPYVQHFGYQRCKETWDSLEEYNKSCKGEFPPPTGSSFWVK